MLQAFAGTEPGYCWWILGPSEIAGIKLDVNGRAVAVCHGILGRRQESDCPLGGATGYTTWHPLPGAPRESGAWGYWIAETPIAVVAGGGDRQ